MRQRTRRAVNDIAARVKVGMVEEDARSMARDLLTERGMGKGWHHIIVRFGPNTTKDFMEPSEKGIVLGAEDIFFVDIGPVHGDHEGDGGDTFVFGSDPDHLRAKSDVKAPGNDVRDVWFREKLTGRALYDYAEKAAADRGWRLNRDLPGTAFPTSRTRPLRWGDVVAVDFLPVTALVGLGDRDHSSRAQVRCLLRRHPARGSILRLSHRSRSATTSSTERVG